jgi:F-type H+-transporting ATPase subunit b
MADALAKRVAELSQDDKKALTEALDAHSSITVRSAMDLGDGPRGTISSALTTALRPDAQVAFEVRPDLIGGIEVVAGAYRLDWNVSNSLSALAKQLGGPEPGSVEGAVSLR